MKNITFNSLSDKFKFENSVIAVRMVSFGNLLLLVLVLVGNLGTITFPSVAFFCLTSGLLVLPLNFFYDWTNHKINLFILLSYMLILILEIWSIGIPKPLIETTGISKGIFLEMILYIVPFCYIGVRVGFIIPLIIIWVRSWRLKMK